MARLPTDRLSAAAVAVWCVMAGGHARAGWSFDPSGAISEVYDSNVLRVDGSDVADLTTQLQTDFKGVYDGSKSEALLAYSPAYEWFLENRELNAMNHLARGSWIRQGARVSANLSGFYGLYNDRRLAPTDTPNGVSPPPGIDSPSPFLTDRVRTESYGVVAGTGIATGAYSRVDIAGAFRQSSYDDLTLIDSSGRVLQTDYAAQASRSVSWSAGYRYEDYRTSQADTSGFHSVGGNSALETGRIVNLSLQLGIIVDVFGNFIPVTGTDRLLGSLFVNGDHRVFQWSTGVFRNVTVGGGLGEAVFNDGGTANMAWEIGRPGTLTVGLVATRSNQATAVGDLLDLFAYNVNLRYSRTINQRWFMAFWVSAVKQTGDSAGNASLFEQNRAGLTFTVQGGKG
jgi:hypothetical protein